MDVIRSTDRLHCTVDQKDRIHNYVNESEQGRTVLKYSMVSITIKYVKN
jgi:hypothetical protein